MSVTLGVIAEYASYRAATTEDIHEEFDGLSDGIQPLKGTESSSHVHSCPTVSGSC